VNCLTTDKPQFRGNLGELEAKSKIEDQRLTVTLMMYQHAENLPTLSRDKKE